MHIKKEKDRQAIQEEKKMREAQYMRAKEISTAISQNKVLSQDHIWGLRPPLSLSIQYTHHLIFVASYILPY
jgi:hypothetical protein